jgi:hypothetical protein
MQPRNSDPHSFLNSFSFPHIAVIMAPGIAVPASEVIPSSRGTKLAASSDHDIVLKTFRLLIADLCQQFNGGHPG